MQWIRSEEKSLQQQAQTPVKLTVETIDNHIYFYSEVDSDRCLALVKSLREIDSRLRNEHSSRSLSTQEYPYVPIWLHINSPGGALFTAFGVADQIATLKTPVLSVVEGYAASAATILSLSCTKRFILANSFMLIHQLSSGHWGKYEEFKDEMKLLDMAMRNLTNFYVKRTKINVDMLQDFLKRDSWFNAEQCVELGLVDAIL